jgi:UDP-2,3-diacylglucosamine hydrolase
MSARPARVAGVRVATASDDDRPRTFVLSDLHVTEAGGEPLAWLDELLARAQAEPARTRVLILGDLFDAYVGPRQLRVGAWRALADRLARAVAAGVPVTVLQGNRDFMLDDAFTAQTGCRVVEGALDCVLAGTRTIALHGDELLLRDVAHQRSRRWLRHPLLRAVLKRLPWSLSGRLARTARTKSTAGTSMARAADPQRFEPVRGAALQAFATGARRLVFGHVHAGARGELGPGQEYVVLPAFDQAGVHLVGQDGELRFHARNGDVLPDFGPRRFLP